MKFWTIQIGLAHFIIKSSSRKRDENITLYWGWDGNNNVSTKKIIDVMYIAGKGQIRFGAPILKDKMTSKE